MGEEIRVEDSMLEEIDTMKYYLSKEEFQDTLLHLEDHKPKLINFGKPVEFVKIKSRVSNYSSNFNECSSSTYEESPNRPCKKKQIALQAIEKYYDRRGLKRKLGYARLGNDEDRRQCSTKKIVIEEDTLYNLKLLADACYSIDKVDVKPKPVIRLKTIPRPSAKNCLEIAKVKSRKSSRKAVKIKKNRNNTGKTKKGKDKIKYDVPKVDQLPPEYLEKIRELKNGRNIQKIAQKQLTASDINRGLSRLLLNRDNIIAETEFLSKDEEEKIRMKDEYIKAKLLEPMGRIQKIRLTNWDMVRNSYYVLLNTWKKLVTSNSFGVNDVVQVWTFRFDGKLPNQLGVAVVRIFTAPRESSSGEGNGTGCLCSS